MVEDKINKIDRVKELEDALLGIKKRIVDFYEEYREIEDEIDTYLLLELLDEVDKEVDRLKIDYREIYIEKMKENLNDIYN